MQKLFLIAFFVAHAIKVNATIVYASEFGWNANNATSAFQSAINSGADTIFNDCVFLNVSQDAADKYNTPIWIEVSDYSEPCPRFGGAEFNDCLLSYTTDLNFLGSYGEINTSPPSTSVTLTAQNRIIECSGQNCIMESVRVSDNKSFPVAVSYLIDGTAIHGEDFSLMNGFMIIPSYLDSQKYDSILKRNIFNQDSNG